MEKNERTKCMYPYFLVFSCVILLSGCCSNPKPVEPSIANLEQQQTNSAVIVERVEVETVKLVHDLQVIKAPPEIIERATVIVKDAVDLKASLEKERILTADLKIRVDTLLDDNEQLKTEVKSVKTQRNVGILIAGMLLALLILIFKLK